MTVEYVRRELYGGAVVADLPSDFIDASDLRQIPDHQELHLSPETLTSVIFEINTYQTPTDIDLPTNITTLIDSCSFSSSSSATSGSNNNTDSEKENTKASTWHLLDPITETGGLDEIDPSSLTLPATRVTLSPSSPPPPPPKNTQNRNKLCANHPTYIQSCTVLENDNNRTESKDEKETKTKTQIYQILVRIQECETDFCVRINVPLKELVTANEAGTSSSSSSSGLGQQNQNSKQDQDQDRKQRRSVEQELQFAEQMRDRIVNSLEMDTGALLG